MLLKNDNKISFNQSGNNDLNNDIKLKNFTFLIRATEQKKNKEKYGVFIAIQLNKKHSTNVLIFAYFNNLS